MLTPNAQCGEWCFGCMAANCVGRRPSRPSEKSTRAAPSALARAHAKVLMAAPALVHHRATREGRDGAPGEVVLGAGDDRHRPVRLMPSSPYPDGNRASEMMMKTTPDRITALKTVRGIALCGFSDSSPRAADPSKPM